MMKLPPSVAIIGKGLDLKYEGSDGQLHKVNTRGLALCAAPDRRTLFLWPMPTREHRKPLEAFPASKATYRTWNEFDPDEVLEDRPRLSQTTRRLGLMVEIGYRSDKWSRARKETDYQHPYKSEVLIEECGDVLRISGGRQRITADGIKG